MKNKRSTRTRLFHTLNDSMTHPFSDSYLFVQSSLQVFSTKRLDLIDKTQLVIVIFYFAINKSYGTCAFSQKLFHLKKASRKNMRNS